MTSTDILRTIGSKGGKFGDLSRNSGKGMYSGKGSGSEMNLCLSWAKGGRRNSGRSTDAGTGSTSAKLLT